MNTALTERQRATLAKVVDPKARETWELHLRLSNAKRELWEYEHPQRKVAGNVRGDA